MSNAPSPHVCVHPLNCSLLISVEAVTFHLQLTTVLRALSIKATGYS
jgi:hypothetical protein